MSAAGQLERTDAEWLEAIEALCKLTLESIGDIKKSGRLDMEQTISRVHFVPDKAPHFRSGPSPAAEIRPTVECVKFWGWSIKSELKALPFFFETSSFGANYSNTMDWYQKYALEAPIAAKRFCDVLKPGCDVLRASLEVIHHNMGCVHSVIGESLSGIMSNVAPDEQIEHVIARLNENYEQLEAMKVIMPPAGERSFPSDKVWASSHQKTTVEEPRLHSASGWPLPKPNRNDRMMARTMPYEDPHKRGPDDLRFGNAPTYRDVRDTDMGTGDNMVRMQPAPPSTPNRATPRTPASQTAACTRRQHD